MGPRRMVLLLGAIALLCSFAFGQGMTGTLTGTVLDPGGAAVPNVKVEIKNLTTGAVRTVNTGAEGIFVFNSVTPATYDLTVTATAGFKAYSQKNLAVTANERRDLGNISLALGSLTEEVSVTAAATPVQTASSENSKLVETTQIQNITMKGRDLFAILQTVPGVNFGNAMLSGSNNDATSNASGTLGSMQINGGGSARANFTVDGVLDLDNGNNAQVAFEPTIDTIAEVRVLTSNYQAEFGHNSSGQISVITKGGSQEFHGTGFVNKRHEMFNAKPFFDNLSSTQKSKYRFFVWGYTVGGPLYIPKLFNTQKNKLFFFWSQEYTRQKPRSDTPTAMVPTADQLAGIFYDRCLVNTGVGGVPCTRGYTDNNGNDRSNYLLNPAAGKTQFVAPGDMNSLAGTDFFDTTSAKIGQSMMKFLPSPNLCTAAAGIYNGKAISPDNCPAGYNTGQAITNPSWNYGANYMWSYTESHPRRNDTARIDWNITSKLNSYARWSRDSDVFNTGFGIPIRDSANQFNPFSVDFNRPGHGIAVGLTYTLSPTMVNEFTFGKIWGGVGWYIHDETQPLRANMGNPPSFHNYATDPAVLASVGPRWGMSTPGQQNFGNYVPNVSFGGGFGSTVAAGRTETNPSTAPCWGQCPYHNWAESWTFADNLSKVQGKHNLKFGVYVERTAKVQAGNNGSYLGAWSFTNDNNNPYDTQDGYANAYLGNYRNYAEGGRNEGNWWFWQTELYAQDSWRVNRRLTLDLGIRFYGMPPIANLNTGKNGSAEYVPSALNMNQVMRIYQGACVTLATMQLYSTADRPCPNNASVNTRAWDPATNTFAIASLINTFVPVSVGGYTSPETRTPWPGMLVAGTDSRLPVGLYNVPALSPALRFGFAWDVFGNGKTAVRGGIGQFLNRLSYNQIAAPVGYAPIIPGPYNLYFGHITDVQTRQSQAAVSPATMNTDFLGNQQNEATYNGSLMIQQNVGFSTVIEASWVFNLRRHLPYQVSRNFQPLFWAYDNGANWLDPQSQYMQNNARTGYRGGNSALGLLGGQYYYDPSVCSTCAPTYGNIQMQAFEESANYHALQVNLRRNMTKHLSYGWAYTWNKYMGLGTAFLNNNDQGGGRSPIFPDKFRNWGPGYQPTPHLFTINYVYETPNLGQKLNSKMLGWVTDHWTVSGLTQWRSNAMADIPNPGFSNAQSACSSASNCYPEWNWTGSGEGRRAVVSGDYNLSSIGQTWMVDPAFPKKALSPAPGSPAVNNAYGMNGTGDNQLINAQAFSIAYPCSAQAQADPHYGIGKSLACFGNAGQGSLVNIPGSRVNNWDITFSKNFPLKSERRNLTFRAEMYNIFNHTQFRSWNITPQYDWRNWLNNTLVNTNADLNRMTGAMNPRQMSMSLRLIF